MVTVSMLEEEPCDAACVGADLLLHDPRPDVRPGLQIAAGRDGESELIQPQRGMTNTTADGEMPYPLPNRRLEREGPLPSGTERPLALQLAIVVIRVVERRLDAHASCLSTSVANDERDLARHVLEAAAGDLRFRVPPSSGRSHADLFRLRRPSRRTPC